MNIKDNEKNAVAEAAMLDCADRLESDGGHFRAMMADVRAHVSSAEQLLSSGPSTVADKPFDSLSTVPSPESEGLLTSSELYEKPYLKLVRVV